ncbi:MAG: FtsX-like permease family protein [Bacteroidales bacterium]|nr:FtsX-like permease family protein [Bacteroidales bacterium]
MLKNFIITSLRYLGKNFLFVGINILGLAVALALCITAYLNNKYDMDWDKTNGNYEDIYKINITREIQDRQQEYGFTPFALAPLLKQDLSGVEEITRYRNSYSPVKYGEKIFSKRIGYADPNFCDVFTFDIINGNENGLKEKGNILINERIANVYFGKDDPIGKVISIVNDKNQETTFIVAGVFKNLPYNSSFRCELLTQLENFEDMWEIEAEKWDSWVGATYLLVRNKDNISEINEQLKKYIPLQNDIREDWKITSFFTKSLKLTADDREVWANWQRSSMHPAAVATPPIMAIFILIIAAFNFMNSSISFAGKRLKEIGLRKVFGGLRKHIIIQFLSENLVISFIAIVLGIFISGFLVPAYGSMWEGLELDLSFTDNPALVIFVLILWLVTALLAGAYPAFYISKFNPVKIFRDNLKLKNKNLLSRVLLGFQFFTSVMALVMGVIFAQNAVFQENIDLGYDKENLIILSMHNNNDYKPFEQVVKANTKIEMYAGTNYHIGYGNYNRSIKYLDEQIETNIMHIGFDYLPAMKVKITDGRGFNLENQSGDFAENNVIVNEKFVADFGFENPIGKTIYMNDTLAMQIVGVSNNVYLYGAWAPVDPLIYRLAQEEDFGRILIRTSPQSLKEVNDMLRAEWAELVPNYPYEGQFQEELLEEAKEINNNIRVIFVFLAICALFLSVIGLYTLVSLSVLNRTKEVGIRKVHGASVKRIMLIVSKPFSLLIIISTLLGLVAGYYMAIMLMGSIFSVHMTPNTISFAIPVLVIVITSVITIIWRVYKAAEQNPAKSLRYE